VRTLFRYQDASGAALIVVEDDEHDLEVQLYTNLGMLQMKLPRDDVGRSLARKLALWVVTKEVTP
jgi:hypothetical protein